MDILDQIDRATSGLCPCGAGPRPGSAYCGYDCEPGTSARDTTSDHDGTRMRWRPDMVTADEPGDRELIKQFRRGPFNAQIFVYRNEGQPSGHLRLDDGYRFVGMDVTDEDIARDGGDLWQRLERELTDSRRIEPHPDPWNDVADSWATAWQEWSVSYRAAMARVVEAASRFTAARDDLVTSLHQSWGVGRMQTIQLDEPVRVGETYTLRIDNDGARLVPCNRTEQEPAESAHPLAVMNAQRSNRTYGPQRPNRPPRQLRR